MQRLPTLPLAIKAPAGGDEMPMGMILAMTPMRVEHHDVAPLQGFAPDLAQELIQALDAAAHQRAQQDRSIVIERRAEHGRDRQDAVAIDDPLVEDLAHLADTG